VALRVVDRKSCNSNLIQFCTILLVNSYEKYLRLDLYLMEDIKNMPLKASQTGSGGSVFTALASEECGNGIAVVCMSVRPLVCSSLCSSLYVSQTVQ
jgi:hypothetical protein